MMQTSSCCCRWRLDRVAAELGGKNEFAGQDTIARMYLGQLDSRMAAGYTVESRSVARGDSSAGGDWKDAAEFRYVQLGT